MKYRDNMSPAERRAFMRKVRREERLFDEIAKREEVSASLIPEWVEDDGAVEDEMALLRRAALNHRGEP